MFTNSEMYSQPGLGWTHPLDKQMLFSWWIKAFIWGTMKVETINWENALFYQRIDKCIAADGAKAWDAYGRLHALNEGNKKWSAHKSNELSFIRSRKNSLILEKAGALTYDFSTVTMEHCLFLHFSSPLLCSPS